VDFSDSILLAAALHAGVLWASARAMPPLGDVDLDVAESYQHVFGWYQIAPADPEEDDRPAQTPADDAPDGRERSESRCSEARGGSMGDPAAVEEGRRYGVRGPADNPDPHLAQLGGQSWEWPESMIGLSVRPQWGGDPAAPVAPWGRDDSLGNDAHSARGNMRGDAVASSLGSPGAGLGLKRICPTCGDDGRGGPRALALDTGEGGATGTERAR
jgi:hypothetical protein